MRDMDIETALNEAKKAIESVNDYVIEVGVIDASDSKRKIVEFGINNAELMFIHENGSPLRNLPARPVLELTIQNAISTLLPKALDRISDGCFNKGWNEDDVRKELEKMCIRMQNYARNVIYRSNLLAPDSPATIKRKGSDRPLLDTGQLARSITCRLSLKR